MKKLAMICDIDGTIAHGTDRTPFDWAAVGSDSVDPVIYTLLRRLEQDYYILMVTGRDAVCRSITKDWLRRNRVPWDALFMRPEGDKRPDSEIKLEIFRKYIEPSFAVEFVLEDRNRVVEMWRSIGLKCLQVQPGDF